MPRHGLTRTEGLGLAVTLFVLAGLLAVWAIAAARREARRIRCVNHLNGLAKAMATYIAEHGDDRWYACPLGRGTRPDDYNGAEWLASLYWVEIAVWPPMFLCPSTEDSNDEGRDLGRGRAAPTFGPQTVSYAAIHYRSLTDTDGSPKAGAIPAADGFSPNEPMASDDTQGTPHHSRRGANVLFFDTHVEWTGADRVDPARSVGTPGGLLWRLRN
jgi:prepilin-type processing-associated H-X9-DG protein